MDCQSPKITCPTTLCTAARAEKSAFFVAVRQKKPYFFPIRLVRLAALGTKTAHKALRMLRKEEQLRRIAGEAGGFPPADGTVEPPNAADDLESCREAIFEIAMRQFLADGSVADRTKRIFERTAVNGESPDAVAASFKMTRHAVDQAKSRAMARLREIVKRLEDVDAV